MDEPQLLLKRKKRPWPPEPEGLPDVHEAELLKKKRKIAERDVGVPEQEDE